MPKQPLAEVFGFPINNFSKEADRHRRLKLCPFNNKVPNCTKDFEFYLEDPQANKNFDWSKRPGYPNPDYLSSSRKRLAPQLIYKGGILNEWKKKSAVALQRSFFETLPTLPEVNPERANLAWFIYDLERNTKSNRFQLKLTKTVYTDFSPALERITRPEAGSVQSFMEILQEKLDEKLDGNASQDAPSLQDIVSGGEG